MKLLFTALVTAVLGVLLWYGIMMGSGVRACTRKYQDLVVGNGMQLSSMLADHRIFCTTSYDALISWGDCAANADKRMPPILLPRLRPVVLGVLQTMGDTGTDLTVLKQLHDDRCSDEIDLMFYPPPLEQ